MIGTTKNIFLFVFLFIPLQAAGTDTPPVQGIKHIVLCWVHDPGDSGQINLVRETSRELENIPGMLELIIGQAVKSERKIVDDTFDVGLVMTFPDKMTMEQYLVHEDHVSRVKNVLAPSCKRIQVYDIQY